MIDDEKIKEYLREGDIFGLNKYLIKNGVSSKVAKEYIQSLFIDNLNHRLTIDVADSDEMNTRTRNGINKKRITNVFIITFVVIALLFNLVGVLSTPYALFVFCSGIFIIIVKFKLRRFLK